MTALSLLLAFLGGALIGHLATARRKPRPLFDKPIGKVRGMTVDRTGLSAEVEFTPEAKRALTLAGVLPRSFGEFDYWTIQAMRKQGGSFVRALADMAERADNQNLERIKATWPEYWGDYEEMGQTMRFEACAEGMCDGSGEVVTDTMVEGNIEKGTGTQKCLCRV